MKPMIQVDNLWFDYDPDHTSRDEWTLQNIQLAIHLGEFVSIIGPNGSGKSTLAKLLNGLILPTEGSLMIAGVSTQDEEFRWQIRSRVGMVFQNPDNQIVASTVEDDIAFGLENLGISRAEMKKRMEQVLILTGLVGLEKQDPHSLSGGQKQRLAIAGVLAMQPDIIILDEATSMLDPQGKKEVLEIVQKLHRDERKTIIQVTHKAEEAFMGERIIVMDQGRIHLDMPSDQLYPNAMCLKERGLDVPLAIELHHRLRQQGLPLPERISSEEELVHALWTLLPNK